MKASLMQITGGSRGASPSVSGRTVMDARRAAGAPRPGQAGTSGVVRLLGAMILAVLSACQSPAAMTGQDATAVVPREQQAGGKQEPALLSVPRCRDAATATLSNGLVVHYEGADPGNPEVCLVSWRGRTHRFLAGFWWPGRYGEGTPAERAAIRNALTGPVGTTTSFEDTRADLWGTVTVEHLANPVLRLKDGLRRTVQLKVVRHDAWGRPEVKRIALHWIDVRTGIELKRQTVTQLAGGQQLFDTTWRVEELLGANS